MATASKSTYSLPYTSSNSSQMPRNTSAYRPPVAPVPTPIQPYSSGGNAYISGYGPYVPQSSFPIATSTNGGTIMNNGQIVTNGQVLGAKYNTVNSALRAGDTTIANARQQSSNLTPYAASADINPPPSGGSNNQPPPSGGGRDPNADKNSVLASHPNSDYGNYAYDLSPDEFYRLIDQGANAQFGYLNDFENTIRGQQPGIIQGINDQYNTGKSQVEGAKTSAFNTLGENTKQAGMRREDALSAARRLYNELRQGSYQRFGGASSAGEAATALMNIEQQRQMGSTNREYGTAIRQIENQKADVENSYQTNLLQLEQAKNAGINQAQTDFQNRLLQIAQGRAQTESERTNARLAALTQLRSQLNNIALQHEAWKQQLEAARANQTNSINSVLKNIQTSAAGGATAINNLMNQTTTNPQANIKLPGQVGLQTGATPTLTNSIGLIANPSGYTKEDPLRSYGASGTW